MVKLKIADATLCEHVPLHDAYAGRGGGGWWRRRCHRDELSPQQWGVFREQLSEPSEQGLACPRLSSEVKPRYNLRPVVVRLKLGRVEGNIVVHHGSCHSCVIGEGSPGSYDSNNNN